MITVKRGNETTEVNLEGKLGTLMDETISVIESIRQCIIDNVDNYPDVIFEYVNKLIDAAWGK